MKSLQKIEILPEEMEALRLKDFEGFSQEEAASKMETSQSTFHRIISSARKKISIAIVKGMAIEIRKH